MIGEVFVQREVQGGHVWSAVPIVLAADDERLALYRPAGTVCMWPSHPRDHHPPFAEVTQRPEPWAVGRMAGLLTLVREGEDYSISLMWHADWSFWGWYVDFIRPYRRTPIGWDFGDVYLDLIVSADGAITTKDEDQLANAKVRGEVTHQEVDAAYRRRDELAAMAHAGIGVFAEAWPDWRPDDSWNHPALSDQATKKLEASPTAADFEFHRSWWLAPNAV